MAVEPDSAGVHFPLPLVYLGALLLGLGVERFVTFALSASTGGYWPQRAGRPVVETADEYPAFV